MNIVVKDAAGKLWLKMMKKSLFAHTSIAGPTFLNTHIRAEWWMTDGTVWNGYRYSWNEKKFDSNPMIWAYGFGQDGKRCKHCSYLHKKQFAGTYYKCELRGDTNGSGTDHRVNWAACSKFEAWTNWQALKCSISLNPNLACWNNILDDHERCDVLAYILGDALSPLEQHYHGLGNNETERIHKLWCDYAYAIFLIWGDQVIGRKPVKCSRNTEVLISLARCAKFDSFSGSSSPSAMAWSISFAETSMMSETKDSSLIFAPSSTFWMRLCCRARSSMMLRR